jgi:RNA polymerase sigma factor (sigma-70 family)
MPGLAHKLLSWITGDTSFPDRQSEPSPQRSPTLGSIMAAELSIDTTGIRRKRAMPTAESAPARFRRFPALSLAGDWDQASELIAQYFPIVTHIVRRYHCSWSDREDLYQEGCLVILEAARDFRQEDGSFDRFMIRAIERRLRQCRRTTVRIASHETHSWDELEEIEALLTRDRSPAGAAVSATSNALKAPGDLSHVVDAEWFKWVLTQLTTLQRHVVLRYFMEGATEQEIAAELGVRQQSVHAAKRGALTKLRKLFR